MRIVFALISSLVISALIWSGAFYEVFSTPITIGFGELRPSQSDIFALTLAGAYLGLVHGVVVFAGVMFSRRFGGSFFVALLSVTALCATALAILAFYVFIHDQLGSRDIDLDIILEIVLTDLIILLVLVGITLIPSVVSVSIVRRVSGKPQ